MEKTRELKKSSKSIVFNNYNKTTIELTLDNYYRISYIELEEEYYLSRITNIDREEEEIEVESIEILELETNLYIDYINTTYINTSKELTLFNIVAIEDKEILERLDKKYLESLRERKEREVK